ncbi:MAG: MarR family transcriptional regulator [Metallosphaera sp.]
MEQIKLNKNIEVLLSTPLKILLKIYMLGETIVTQLVKESDGMSATTITKYVKQLEEMGLIEVEVAKTNVGTEKKIIKVSKKGLEVIDYIMKLNKLLE